MIWRGLAANSIRLDIDPGNASWKPGMLGETRDTIKQAAIRVARRTPDSVTFQEIFGEFTTAHNYLHENHWLSRWQLRLERTPSDKSICENPDLAQCSVEVVNEAAKQRLRAKEESCKRASKRSCHLEHVAMKFIKPDLGRIGQQATGAPMLAKRSTVRSLT